MEIENHKEMLELYAQSNYFNQFIFRGIAMPDTVKTLFFGIIVCLLSTLDPAGAAQETGTVLITGANRGLGLEFARQFKARGYDVIGTARKPDKATALHKLGAQVEQLDVADDASAQALAKRLAGRSIDILINNAGIIGSNSRSFTDLDFNAMVNTYQVNALGPMRVTQALYNNLKQGKGRKVVNITSVMGSIGMNFGGGYDYRASKVALNMLTNTLSKELGKDGFTCIVIHPGWVQTDMGGSSAPVTPKQSISGMIAVIDGLDNSANGKFFDYTGKELPW